MRLEQPLVAVCPVFDAAVGVEHQAGDCPPRTDCALQRSHQRVQPLLRHESPEIADDRRVVAPAEFVPDRRPRSFIGFESVNVDAGRNHGAKEAPAGSDPTNKPDPTRRVPWIVAGSAATTAAALFLL